MLDIIRIANLALAFLLELAMLAALGYWAFRAAPGGWLSWAAAVVVVAIAIGLWAAWGAPKSATRLAMPALLVFKIVMFGAAAIALFASGQAMWAALFAVLAVLHLALAAAFGQV
jgi:hypothetical protein